MDIIEREVPYGELEKKGRRALYKIKDPFFRFWFKVVGHKLSILLQGDKKIRREILREAMPKIVSEIWESLCRRAMMRLSSQIKELQGSILTPAGRYWAKGEREWDIVSRSIDKQTLILGEAKWTSKEVTATFVKEVLHQLQSKGIPRLQGIDTCRICYCVFVPEKPKVKLNLNQGCYVFDIKEVMRVLRD